MKSKKALLACVSLFVFSASSHALAGTRPGAFSFRLADGYYYFAQKRHLQNTSIPTIELGYEFDNRWGMKVGASVLNTNTKSANTNMGAHGFIYTLDGVYKIATYGNFEPYALGGVGVTSIKTHNNNDPTNQANINAGVGSHYFVDPSIALNVEAKDLYTISGGKNDVQLTAGVTFYFSGQQPEPVRYKDESYK